MKALIVIREKDSGWVRDYFPEFHPGMLPVCNKPLLEYYVDFALLSGCTAVRIIVEDLVSTIENYFEQGDRWGCEISYNVCKENDSADTIIEKNSAYCADTPLLIMDGFFFIHYDKSAYQPAALSPDIGMLTSSSSGSVLFAADRGCLLNISDFSASMDFALSPFAELEDIFSINMQILQAEQEHYVLPGYGVERGVLLGQNVSIARDTEVIPPVIIGDNVRLQGKTVIGPDVAIGSNVIVDEGNKITRSVIFGGSYVGHELFVDKRFVNGSHVISPSDGTILDIQDAFLLSSVGDGGGGRLRRVFNIFLGVLILLFQAVPYGLLSLLLKMKGRWTVETRDVLLNSKGATLRIPVIINEKRGSLDKLFAALGLEKFPLLRQALTGKMQVVGNRPLADTQANRRMLADFPEYLPGIFTYSEGEECEDEETQEAIVERYYAANRSVRADIVIFFKILFSNLFVKEVTS